MVPISGEFELCHRFAPTVSDFFVQLAVGPGAWRKGTPVGDGVKGKGSPVVTLQLE